EDERGSTKIISAVDYEHQGLDWSFTPERDILKITLNRPLPPNSPLKIYLTYRVKLPSNNFTTYGYGDNRNYYLKDWYLTPAVYSDNWHLYSNKNLEDLYTDITDTAIEITLPRDLFVVSNFYESGNVSLTDARQINLTGTHQKSGELIIGPVQTFAKHITPGLTLLTDMEISRYDEISAGISIERISRFIQESLGEFPHRHLLVSN